MEQIDESTLLGLSISKNLLKPTSDKHNFWDDSPMKTLHQKISFILRKNKYFNCNLNAPSFNILTKRLIEDNSVWLKSSNINMQFNSLSETNRNSIKLSTESYLNIIHHGSPSPYESDYCISEVFSHYDCKISKKCFDIMNERKKSKGYNLTHKLLYYIIVRNQGCLSVFPKTFSSLTTFICKEILHEINEYANFPLDLELRDIFLEQTLFCMYLGFTTFFKIEWIKGILEWQTPEGQFIHLGNKFEPHINGLASAFLTVIVKSTGNQ